MVGHGRWRVPMRVDTALRDGCKVGSLRPCRAARAADGGMNVFIHRLWGLRVINHRWGISKPGINVFVVVASLRWWAGRGARPPLRNVGSILDIHR